MARADFLELSKDDLSGWHRGREWMIVIDSFCLDRLIHIALLMVASFLW
jgi:hypothetical protein